MKIKKSQQFNIKTDLKTEEQKKQIDIQPQYGDEEKNRIKLLML